MFFADIQRSVSRERFSYYRRIQETKADALALYLYNVALCEALYASLQAIEIVLRNAVHDSLRNLHSNAAWFDIPNLLLANEFERVSAAKRRLTEALKPADPGRIVAELTIGFWASLFSAGYTNKIVYPIVNAVFSHAPKNARTQRAISARLQAIRNLRNRVFHHEPIAHWPNLQKDHQEIVETISWISPSHGRYVGLADRFEEVLASGWQNYRFKVEFLFEELDDTERH
jgi:hypothetical protein